MKTVLLLVTATCLGCAGSNEVLPKVGNALLAAKDSYEEVELARDALETVWGDLCGVDALPVVVASGTCPKVRIALDGVKAGTVRVRDALNLAIDAYTSANDVVKAVQ